MRVRWYDDVVNVCLVVSLVVTWFVIYELMKLYITWFASPSSVAGVGMHMVRRPGMPMHYIMAGARPAVSVANLEQAGHPGRKWREPIRCGGNGFVASHVYIKALTR